jgi:hypothetical protein
VASLQRPLEGSRYESALDEAGSAELLASPAVYAIRWLPAVAVRGQVPEGQRMLPTAVVEERAVLTNELTVVRSVVSSAIFPASVHL